jgi:hypothetical protein
MPLYPARDTWVACEEYIPAHGASPCLRKRIKQIFG